MKTEDLRFRRIGRFMELMIREMKPKDREDAEVTIQALAAVLATSYLASRDIPRGTIEEASNVVYHALQDWHDDWKARQ